MGPRSLARLGNAAECMAEMGVAKSIEYLLQRLSVVAVQEILPLCWGACTPDAIINFCIAVPVELSLNYKS